MDQIKTGKFIAQLRKEKNITQEVLGDAVNVTNKTVSRWETGKYMPDIDTLLLLSRYFNISINEILCGQRLSDNEFREKADENIVEATKESIFTIKEQTEFFKRKWKKEHISFIIIALIVYIGVGILIKWSGLYWLFTMYPALFFITYIIINNRMMIYVEHMVYDKKKVQNL